jgi:hypothetical protein
MFRLTLVPCDPDSRALPRRKRRSIQVEWGERTQDDGTATRVYRLIDRQHDRYIERVTFADGTVPRTQGRPRGSAPVAIAW